MCLTTAVDHARRAFLSLKTSMRTARLCQSAHSQIPYHGELLSDRYNPIKTMKTSFLGTMNMLGLAKRTKARFLLTSTSEVYGDPLEHPQTESYWGNVNPIGERSCYDEGEVGGRQAADAEAGVAATGNLKFFGGSSKMRADGTLLWLYGLYRYMKH